MSKRVILATLAVFVGSAIASADVKDRLYDFTDAYYTANGINPLKLGGRKQAPTTAAVVDTPIFPWQRPVRVISTSSGWGASGEVRFFAVMAGFGPDGFTDNDAGRKAKTIAEQYIEYIFPVKGTDPIGLGALRQSVVLDTSNGYFSNNPLGLWLHVWVSFTDKAFNTADGRKTLEDLQKKNGVAKDGTPIIRTKSEIQNLASKGYISQLTRTDFLRYAVCPIINDPTDGGIAKDAFHNGVRKTDGTFVEPTLDRAFKSLQATGRWP